jgi:hypothetical protein
MRSDYRFTLTEGQLAAIRDVGVQDVEVSFCTSGMVNATVNDEYEITCYTFRKDGSIVRETRGLDSDGWVTDVRSVEGVWTYELQEVE